MEGIKGINSISGFSWADEVEKQEEEAKAQLNQQQKSNPFGSARPREVVLQEKGVDWRKLDQKLHDSSSISYIYRKEKENIAAPTELACRNHQPFPPRNNVLERKIENPRNGWDRNGVPLVSQTLQNQNGALVPPLKYPPKNTMGLMNVETQYRSYNSYGSEFLRSNFHDFNTDNSIRENGRRHFTGWELMHHQSAHKERELHNNNYNERGTLHQERLVFPPSFVNENEREGNSRNEFGRRSSVMERLGPFSIEASAPNNGGVSLNKHSGGMKSSTAVKEVGRREMEPEHGNQQFHADELMGLSVGAMDDAGRGRLPHIVDDEMVEYGGNCRKRALISGFKNNQSQQRRRR